MPNKAKVNRKGPNPVEFLRGGKTVSESLLRGRKAAAKRRLQARFDDTRGIEQRIAKYWSQLKKPATPVIYDPQALKALDGLRGIHKELSRKKLVVPTVAGQIGGILGGRFGAKIVPPFDYAYAIPFPNYGNTTLTGSADKNTGQISANAVSDPQNASWGSMYSEVGVYFHPMYAGTLSVSASPAFSIEWWTNSLSANSTVVALGQASLEIYGQQGFIGASVGAESIFERFDEEATQQVLFDFGSNPHIPTSAQLEVDPSFEYLMFVSLTTHVQTVGWPGSLAGAMMSLTLPSIAFELDMRIVAEP